MQLHLDSSTPVPASREFDIASKSVLTPRQERFVREYLIDLNATQAAVRAGYSTRTARQIGARLLTNVDIVAAVAKAKQARATRLGITADQVLRELARIGFSNVDHYRIDDSGRVVLADDAPDGATCALSSVKEKTRTVDTGETTVTTREVEYKLWDKVSALYKIGQHIGMFGEDRSPPTRFVIRVVRE
jgi:phage terminase small subunit